MSNVKNGHRPAHAGNGNAPFVEGVNVPTSFSFAFTAGAANVAEVAISVLDGTAALLAGARPFKAWLSDSATGVGLTATSASGTVQAKSASGADLGVLTAKKALEVQPLATGIYTLEITDTAKTAFYVAVQCPYSGHVVVSRVMVTGDYGA
ncbi:hypothetical protein KAR91_88490 [Candidatus Pacearchaeota archaeon]|nr:hypothetical protein [Candidatus Pacearchaeota archaeon]